MPKCLFERATGLYSGGTRYDDVPHDPATQVQVELQNFPDRRAERWDGATGVRPATAQELADYDAAQKDVEAKALVDAPALQAAMTTFLAELNAVRRAVNLPERALADIRAAVVEEAKKRQP